MKMLWTVAVAGILAVLLATTNPGTEQFYTYAEQHMAEAARTSGQDGLLKLADALKQATGLDPARAVARLTVGNLERKDLLFLSVYKSPDHTWLGILNRFIELR